MASIIVRLIQECHYNHVKSDSYSRAEKITPELRILVQNLLEGITPLLSTLEQQHPNQSGRCQQLWCPICASFAFKDGYSHPLLDILSSSGSVMVDFLKVFLTHYVAPSRKRHSSPHNYESRSRSYYQPITIEIQSQ